MQWEGQAVSTSCDDVVLVDADGIHEGAMGTALFGLEPIGLGTTRRESLRGYLVRLAYEHSVRPRDLVARVLAQTEPTIGAWNYARFHARHAITLDGLGCYAEVFARALNGATGRRDLEELTLLPLVSLLAPNGQRLLSTWPRWCPQCLASDTLEQGGGHWQLRWSLAAACHCSEHDCRLLDRCSACGRAQPAIPRWPDLHHCDHCGACLATSEEDRTGATSADGIEALVDDLVASLGLMSPEPSQAWCRALERAVHATAERQRAALCRRMGLQPRALNAWFRNGEKVALDSMLRICAGLRLKPSQMLAGDAIGAAFSLRAVRHRPTLLVRHDVHKRAEVEECLTAALQSDHPQALRAVAERAGVSRGYLKYWFAEACRELTKRRAQLRLAARERRHAERIALIRDVVDAAVAAGIHPGRKLVEAAARRAGFSLMLDGLFEHYLNMAREWPTS